MFRFVLWLIKGQCGGSCYGLLWIQHIPPLAEYRSHPHSNLSVITPIIYQTFLYCQAKMVGPTGLEPITKDL